MLARSLALSSHKVYIFLIICIINAFLPSSFSGFFYYDRISPSVHFLLYLSFGLKCKIANIQPNSLTSLSDVKPYVGRRLARAIVPPM